ncbi:hemopexin repeat-containing protein [Streptomyces sp. NPDC007117]|uniref:hemopexin repeat-containing protein n=1 Tax=Streptomyces sp. NPDC007117 TaxID=3154314 RepID=UPI0033CF6CC8
MSEGTGIDAQRSPEARALRLERWRALLSGTNVTADGPRVDRAVRSGPVNLLMGVWLHATARLEQEAELTGLERSLLEPLCRVLGEEEVRAVGALYREQRETRSVTVVPQSVAFRSLAEGYEPEDFRSALVELLPLIGAMPNLAVVDPAVLAQGRSVDDERSTAALGEYGYGVTGFTGEAPGQTEHSGPPRAGTSFRARLEWDSFYCKKAVGDQWGGRDEIYWTAACNAAGYGHTTRTAETGAVTEEETYPIHGDHATGSKAFFDTTLNGCGTAVITLWEADQSHAEWYEALGEALQDVVDSLKYHDLFLSLIPSTELFGYLYTGVSMLATIWESLRNKDDLVLTRGIAFGPAALGMMHQYGGVASWTFDATADGMGHFTLYTRYTGEEPVVPPGSSTLISSGWPGLAGTAFTSDLDAACNVPGSSNHLYLFKGNEYLRYDAPAEEVVAGPKSIAGSWPGLADTAFTSGIDAACQVPGSSTDVYLFRGTWYVRYNVSTEKIVTGPSLTMFGWPGVSFIGTDAASAVPDHPKDVYLFRGDQYVRYNAVDNKIVNGPWSISAGWPSVEGTAFSYALSAACSAPGHEAVYLFKGDRYLRYPI